MPRYYVITPNYTTYDGGTFDASEYGADCVEVEAKNRREARVLAVRQWRKQSRSWVRDQTDSGACPFTGLKVEPASDAKEGEGNGQ